MAGKAAKHLFVFMTERAKFISILLSARLKSISLRDSCYHSLVSAPFQGCVSISALQEGIKDMRASPLLQQLSSVVQVGWCVYGEWEVLMIDLV